MPSTRPRRLTQQERSAATRQALIDSTIDSLIELGFERASTTEISERAGLSRGAHLHHFQTRAALLAAAVETLAERAAADMEDAVAQLPRGAQRPAAVLDMIWALFNGPLFLIVLDLSVRSRTDEELRQSLEPLEAVLGDSRPLRTAFTEDPEDHGQDALISLVVASVRGLVVMGLLEPERSNAAQWRSCRKQLLSLFAAQR